jgi:hypothetical protein
MPARLSQNARAILTERMTNSSRISIPALNVIASWSAADRDVLEERLRTYPSQAVTWRQACAIRDNPGTAGDRLRWLRGRRVRRTAAESLVTVTPGAEAVIAAARAPRGPSQADAARASSMLTVALEQMAQMQGMQGFAQALNELVDELQPYAE